MSDDSRLGQPDEAPAGGTGSRGKQRGPLGVDPRISGEKERGDREFTENREVTDDERLELFIDAQMQSILPDLPRMPGYHVCWLTTTNPRDSIQWRRRLGYELIRLEQVPGWDGVVHQSGGDYAGVIGVNEMVAARIPMRLYEKYMVWAHHTLPLQEEEKLRASVDNFADRAARSKSGVVEMGDGTADLVQRARPMRVQD